MLVDVNQKPEISKSKYELTLAEFPLFILSKKDGKGIQSIVYEDTIQGKDASTATATGRARSCPPPGAMFTTGTTAPLTDWPLPPPLLLPPLLPLLPLPVLLTLPKTKD